MLAFSWETQLQTFCVLWVDGIDLCTGSISLLFLVSWNAFYWKAHCCLFKRTTALSLPSFCKMSYVRSCFILDCVKVWRLLQWTAYYRKCSTRHIIGNALIWETKTAALLDMTLCSLTEVHRRFDATWYLRIWLHLPWECRQPQTAIFLKWWCLSTRRLYRSLG